MKCSIRINCCIVCPECKSSQGVLYWTSFMPPLKQGVYVGTWIEVWGFLDWSTLTIKVPKARYRLYITSWVFGLNSAVGVSFGSFRRKEFKKGKVLQLKRHIVSAIVSCSAGIRNLWWNCMCRVALNLGLPSRIWVSTAFWTCPSARVN